MKKLILIFALMCSAAYGQDTIFNRNSSPYLEWSDTTASGGVGVATFDDLRNLTMGGIEPKYWIGIDTTAINTTDRYFMGYAQKAIALDTICFSMRRLAGSPDVTVKLYYGSDLNDAGTAIVTAGNQITTYSGQTKVTSFDNGTIPAGNVVWATFSAVSVRPKGIFITLIGH